jgi:hypothetical protein
MSDVSENFTMTCWHCAGTVKVKGGQGRRHICHLRLIGRWKQRIRHASYLEGYEFAVRGLVKDDPMVLADADDFGTGWAGSLRSGSSPVTVLLGEDE